MITSCRRAILRLERGTRQGLDGGWASRQVVEQVDQGGQQSSQQDTGVGVELVRPISRRPQAARPPWQSAAGNISMLYARGSRTKVSLPPLSRMETGAPTPRVSPQDTPPDPLSRRRTRLTNRRMDRRVPLHEPGARRHKQNPHRFPRNPTPPAASRP